ncbi:hypothetical protein ADL25_43950 [Streptomyces sp. NRRL F-5122]|nr:hypothetical protein ADL25_43950 [Streptomyces sp. NRRL F-5122]
MAAEFVIELDPIYHYEAGGDAFSVANLSFGEVDSLAGSGTALHFYVRLRAVPAHGDVPWRVITHVLNLIAQRAVVTEYETHGVALDGLSPLGVALPAVTGRPGRLARRRGRQVGYFRLVGLRDCGLAQLQKLRELVYECPRELGEVSLCRTKWPAVRQSEGEVERSFDYLGEVIPQSSDARLDLP